MCMPIPQAIGLGTGVIGALGSLFGKGKGKEIEYSPMNKQGNEMQNQLMQYLMGRIGQQNPFARVNPMSMNAMNMVSSHYTGQPYTQPGWGQGSPGGPNPFASPGGSPRIPMNPGMGGPCRMQGPGGPGGMPGMGGGGVNQQALRQRQ